MADRRAHRAERSGAGATPASAPSTPPASESGRGSLAPRQTVPWWLVVALPAAVFLWRAVRHYGDRPLWRDESATAEFASLGFRDLARAVSHIDLVLAPYYALMHVVLLLADDPRAIRIPSVIAGLAGVAFITMAVRERWGGLAALIAGLFLATNAGFYVTATTGRPYALSAAGLAAAAWIGARERTRSGVPRSWILAVCWAVLMQPLSVLAVPGLAVMALRKCTPRAFVRVLIVPGMLAALLMLVTQVQSAQVSWIRKLSFDSAFTQIERAGTVTTWLPIVLLVLAAAGAQARACKISANWIGWLLAVVLPPFTLWLVTAVAVPLFVVRYAVMFSLALAGFIGASAGLVLALLPERASWRPVAVIAALALASVAVWDTTPALRQELRHHESFDGTEKVSAAVRQRVRAGDGIVYVASASSGGAIYGWARSEGDTTLQRDLLRDLARGTGAKLQVRRIVSTTPLRTVASGSLAPRMWVVGWSPDDWAAEIPGFSSCRRVPNQVKTPRVAVVEMSCPGE